MSENVTYPTKYELTEALGMCRRKFVEEFAQTRGLFIYRATQEYLADQLSKILFDNDDLESIREHAHRYKNKRTTTGFVIAAPDDQFDPKDIIETLRQSPPNPSVTLSAVSQVNEHLQTGSLEYEVNKPGRINLLQGERRRIDYSIEAKGENLFQVFVEASSSSDARYFEAMYKGAVKDKANINIIDFEMLTAPETIQFFDDLSELGLGDKWEKKRVNELTFRRSAPASEDDEHEHQDASEEVLSVINRAILEGKDLRDNAFVKQSEKDGYRFSAMTIEYGNKDLPQVIEMRAEFKLRPELFEINVASYKKRVTEDNVERLESDELASQEEHNLVTAFWYAAKKVYDNLNAAKVEPENIVVNNDDATSVPATEVGASSAVPD